MGAKVKERVAKLLEWPNFVQAECHWQVLNLPKWLRRRQNSPKANKSAILFAPLTIIIAFCLIVFVKSGAKIQNFPQTISFPLEKLTNRHEIGRKERPCQTFGMRNAMKWRLYTSQKPTTFAA
jgi:hypothetical protein